MGGKRGRSKDRQEQDKRRPRRPGKGRRGHVSLLSAHKLQRFLTVFHPVDRLAAAEFSVYRPGDGLLAAEGELAGLELDQRP